MERERIQKEMKSWKGDWTMMGKCVELTPHVSLLSLSSRTYPP